MNRPIWAAVVTAVTTLALSALPAQAAAPLSTPAATAAAAGPVSPVSPKLYDATAEAGTVRVNVVTENRSDLAGAASAGETLQSFDTLPVVTLKVDDGGLDELAAKPGVVSVTEDIPVRPALDQSVPLVGGDKARAAGKTGKGSAVAILDTGVATQHPFLKDRVVAEACFSPADPDYSASSLCPNGTETQEGPGSADTDTGPCAAISECDHGTHVAGVAAGDGANAGGAPAAGVAPGADIIAIQVFSKFDSEDFCGAGATPCVLSFTSAQLAGLEKVWQLRQSGTPVIAANLSLGAGQYFTSCDADSPHKPAIDNLLATGVATVVAAGNNGYGNAVTSPACVSSAIAVGATTDDDELSAFTNRGPLLDLFAPGTSITSSVPGGGYASKNGTSMAAPHVAGALAVLQQAFPDQGIANLESLLKDSGKSITYTGGSTPRIDLGQALNGTVQAEKNIADFNCDGVRDIAISDPEAAVGGHANAGVVRIVYGGGKGTFELSQALATVPGDPETSDGFGEVLADTDYNRDGCGDLIVGVPGEDLGTATDAGMVTVVHGSSGGLSDGAAALNLEQGKGTGALLAASNKSGDRMGDALAAGTTISGSPYLLIGVPGEDAGSLANTGSVFYLRGSVSVAITQGTTGVPGDPEANDYFGTSVAASPEHFAIGTPYEDISTDSSAGTIALFRHNSTGAPLPAGGFDQDSDIVSGGAEPGDHFGASLAMVQYRPDTASTGTDSVLVAGSPGEDVGTVVDAGRVTTFTVNPAGQATQLYDIDQSTEDVAGDNERGDAFGKKVAAVNTDPGAVSNTGNLKLAIGMPGEDVGTVTDAGSIRYLPLLSRPGAADKVVEAGTSGLPATAGANQHIGNHLMMTSMRLYVGLPDGPGSYGSLAAIFYGNAGNEEFPGCVTCQPPAAANFLYKPGSGGLPAAGAAFGWASR
ncbi:S8 family peptidase [Streptomyces coryli]|uniref:S8 family peptidase n=1 Tax=Streptomyces coryli TaxID=1128680 RepID=UPI001F0FDB59|nr:S8 family serine peptidase [Streptomyces coryli]